MTDELRQKIREVSFPAVTYFEDAPYYDTALLRELFHIVRAPYEELSEAETEEKLARGREILASLKVINDTPKKIMLWPEGNMPASGAYKENPGHRYNHDPEFKPYMIEMLLPGDVAPKGAVILCAGGDHGEASFHEAYQTAFDMNELGYQCFILLNRTNRMPYTGPEVGADTARAIRIVRANAEKYRIDANHVAFAGFSNGGLTGEANIQYYSGTKKITDYFPTYVPDALDEYYGVMDAFLCVYGPRWVGAPFDFDGVVYPPVFFAVGRKDKAMDNLRATLPGLIEHNVDIEVHTFAGVPHGQAGVRLVGEPYENFELWLPLADAFMQDVYANK